MKSKSLIISIFVMGMFACSQAALSDPPHLPPGAPINCGSTTFYHWSDGTITTKWRGEWDRPADVHLVYAETRLKACGPDDF